MYQYINNIQKLAKSKGITQVVIAKYLDLSPNAISTALNKVADMKVSQLIKIAELLNVHVSSLFEDEIEEIKNVTSDPKLVEYAKKQSSDNTTLTKLILRLESNLENLEKELEKERGQKAFIQTQYEDLLKKTELK